MLASKGSRDAVRARDLQQLVDVPNAYRLMALGLFAYRDDCVDLLLKVLSSWQGESSVAV